MPWEKKAGFAAKPAPRGDFAPRPAGGPAGGGKVFVPRDAAKKRAYKPAR
jgi:hypothetical protein